MENKKRTTAKKMMVISPVFLAVVLLKTV